MGNPHWIRHILSHLEAGRQYAISVCAMSVVGAGGPAKLLWDVDAKAIAEQSTHREAARALETSNNAPRVPEEHQHDVRAALQSVYGSAWKITPSNATEDPR